MNSDPTHAAVVTILDEIAGSLAIRDYGAAFDLMRKRLVSLREGDPTLDARFRNAMRRVDERRFREQERLRTLLARRRADLKSDDDVTRY